MIKACSSCSNSSVKSNNIDTNKLITINYQQLLLYSEGKVQEVGHLVGYEMQCFFTSRNSPKCHSRKNLNCQAHQDMNLDAGL